MSSYRKRGSSEYSNSQVSELSSVKQKVEISDESKKRAKSTLYKLCFKDWMALVGIFPALVSGALPILFIYFSTDMMDALQDWGKSLQLMMIYGDPSLYYDPMPVFVKCIKIMGGVAAGMAFCKFWITFLWTLVGSRVRDTLKIEMFHSQMRSEVTFFDVTPIGNTLTLLSEDSESVESSFGTVKATQLSSFVQGIVGLVMAFISSWQVALVSLCFIPVVLIVIICLVPALLNFSSLKFKHVSKSMTIAEETLGAVRTVRGFCREEVESKRFMKSTKKAAKYDRNIGLLMIVFVLILMVAIIANMLADFYFGATYVDKGKLEFGKLMTIFMYTMMGAMGIVAIQGTMQSEEKAVHAGARILDIANRIPTIPFDGGEVIENFKGHIEFKNVSFKYPTRDTYVLKNVSFEIKEKQIGALVGHSGSGKSTCVQLLERFYDPTEGFILLDGKDITTLDQHWLHQKTALVSQEPILFRKTIRDNIKYGCQNATDEEVLAAVEIANAKKVLEKLEKGLDTMVGDKGSTLSGGQRQRIAIARAIIKRPIILITDEATSALDAQSEKKVQVALDKVMQDCTSVIVAHRLSTIRNADIIYVFDAGEIKEFGSHDELVAKGGHYYNLVYRQLTEKDAEMHERAQNNSQDSDSSDEVSSESSPNHKAGSHKKIDIIQKTTSDDSSESSTSESLSNI
ncbi:ABC transporter B family member 4 [Tritrichomonas foetus]|uniref:ABC transporter B family member 4 n=1 Tax=Tritrichomonas foetus TaxID=1144522 RepID=A0A1J4JUX0_9EUKA|nr:ABC transporter B family member 4 [Tritrichomonas foetus]|eukprot:OHT02945.1 ABC transporter B family member 4 [Tritrichomonas foetus]